MYLDVTSRSKWVGEPDYIIPAYVDMEDEVEDDEDDDTWDENMHQDKKNCPW